MIIPPLWQDWLTRLEQGVRLPQTDFCPNYLYSRVGSLYILLSQLSLQQGKFSINPISRSLKVKFCPKFLLEYGSKKTDVSYLLWNTFHISHFIFCNLSTKKNVHCKYVVQQVRYKSKALNSKKLRSRSPLSGFGHSCC